MVLVLENPSSVQTTTNVLAVVVGRRHARSPATHDRRYADKFLRRCDHEVFALDRTSSTRAVTAPFIPGSATSLDRWCNDGGR
jgi:hypothetical protein